MRRQVKRSLTSSVHTHEDLYDISKGRIVEYVYLCDGTIGSHGVFMECALGKSQNHSRKNGAGGKQMVHALC